MNIKDLRKVNDLVAQWIVVCDLIKQLNDINMGEDISIPQKVLLFVDRKLAAKGLMSLVVEESGALRKQLEDLGVEL